MNRLVAILFVASAAGCAGQVSGSSSSSRDPTPVDECTMGATGACTQENGNVGSRACEPGQDGYVWGACNAASCTGATMSCTTAESQQGVAQCVNGRSASACGLSGSCAPGAVAASGPNDECESACTLVDGAWQMQDQPCDTPLVLAFHDEPVGFTRAAGEFDLSGLDASLRTDWVSAETPWLAMDRDGNGRIDDGRELFGSMTQLPAGGRALNGFAALAALDDDHDGQITARDAAFEHLVLWRDADQDRRSSPGELVAAKDAGLLAIRLDYDVAPRCQSGDCEVERATFVWRDLAGREHDGAVVDVHLTRR